MQTAILARTPALAAALQRLLGALHAEKPAPGVNVILWLNSLKSDGKDCIGQ